MTSIKPQPGPQTEFAASKADIAIYGGAAGGGKSWALVYEPLRWVHLQGFTAVFFRRLRPQLIGGGSVWEESKGLYPLRGGRKREGSILDWRFPSGSTIEFSHLQYDGDKESHKSKQYTLILWDELTDILESQFWYLQSRNRSTCGVRPYMRGGTNPDPDSFVRPLIDWWIDKDGFAIPERSGKIRWFLRVSGELHWASSAATLHKKFAHIPEKDRRPTSFTFIPAKLEDNKILCEQDPDYRAKLLAMHEIDRQKLLGGNWNVRAQPGDFFPRTRAVFADSPPPDSDIIQTVRAWDKAATKPSEQNPDPDATAGVKMCRTRDGLIWVLDVIWGQEDPFETEKMITGGAEQDGKKVQVAMWQDPGQAGKTERMHFARLLMGYVFRWEPARKDKTTYAKPFSSQWLAGNVRIVRGPWNDRYISEMDGFPGKCKDDQVDASSLASLKLSAQQSGLAALEAMTRM